jgi:hypothetical protein
MITAPTLLFGVCHSSEANHAAARELKEEIRVHVALAEGGNNDNSDGQDDSDEDTRDGRAEGMLTVSTSQPSLL